MERGAATRGKVAKAIAGAEAIEIKATIPDRQIRQALARFGLTSNNDEERYIYFFDTPKLDLLGAGIIARARRVVGEDHDSTVKFRPIDPKDVGPKWRKFRDFKIEADASETSLVKSASFSMPVAKGFIKRVAVGKKPVSAIFTSEQEAFLTAIAGHKIDFSTLAVLGPLLAQRWRFADPGCPWPITAELWRRGDGQADDGALDQGSRGAGRGRGGRLHGLPRGGGCRAGQEPAGQDALGTGLLRRQAAASAGCRKKAHRRRTGSRRSAFEATGTSCRQTPTVDGPDQSLNTHVRAIQPRSSTGQTTLQDPI